MLVDRWRGKEAALERFELLLRNSAPQRRIAVLCGGSSSERDISLRSGEAVAAALARRGHFVARIDPGETDLAGVEWRAYDAAFLALHGSFGEDGQVQEILERASVAYTGSDAAASRLAFSKSASKERFAQRRIPTPDYVLVRQDDHPARISRWAEALGYPIVVKPDRQGSSLGVSLVPSPRQLAPALETCFQFDRFGILEQAIAGSEWTVGLIDEQPFPPIQIETPRPFYDYDAKYLDHRTVYRSEFDVPPAVVADIVAAAKSAALAVGTRGLARVDLRLDPALRPWVLEVNTIPGMTDHSLIPKAAALAGIPFPVLCELAVESTLQRYRASRTSTAA